ncbi:hypothetical protein ES707_09388 [subsurface metagenome]
MPKLATPVQYESALEGLNDIRPLQLAEESKIVIPYPVLCKNPPSKGRPAVGKLARCSEQGALLKSNILLLDKLYTFFVHIHEYNTLISVMFPNRVYGVAARYNQIEKASTTYWSSDTGVAHIDRLVADKYIFLPFIGKIIYFKGYGSVGWIASIDIRGLYK